MCAVFGAKFRSSSSVSLRTSSPRVRITDQVASSSSGTPSLRQWSKVCMDSAAPGPRSVGRSAAPASHGNVP